MVFSIIIVHKTGEHAIQSTVSLDELYKSCNFRKNGDFSLQCEWNNVCLDNITFKISIWGKTTGLKSNINRMHKLYDVTQKKLYGNIAFVFQLPDDSFHNPDHHLWNAFLSSNVFSTTYNTIPPLDDAPASYSKVSKELTYDTYYFSD